MFPIPVLFVLGVFTLAILNLDERGTIEWKGREGKAISDAVAALACGLGWLG